MRIHEAKIAYRLVSDEPSEVCNSPEAIVRYMEGAFDEDPTVEWFFVLAMNRKNRPLGRFMITKGTATTALVHPREVLKPLILAGATAFACAHNHPSGDASPSQADIQVTRTLREAAKIMNIDMLDHVIIGEAEPHMKGCSSIVKEGYYSFAEAGLL